MLVPVNLFISLLSLACGKPLIRFDSIQKRNRIHPHGHPLSTCRKQQTDYSKHLRSKKNRFRPGHRVFCRGIFFCIGSASRVYERACTPNAKRDNNGDTGKRTERGIKSLIIPRRCLPATNHRLVNSLHRMIHRQKGTSGVGTTDNPVLEAGRAVGNDGSKRQYRKLRMGRKKTTTMTTEEGGEGANGGEQPLCR